MHKLTSIYLAVKVSALLRGRFGGYSLERLFRLLLALDSDVAIVVRPKREAARA